MRDKERERYIEDDTRVQIVDSNNFVQNGRQKRSQKVEDELFEN